MRAANKPTIVGRIALKRLARQTIYKGHRLKKLDISIAQNSKWAKGSETLG